MSLTSPRVAGLSGLSLLAGVGVAFALPTIDIISVALVMILVTALLFMSEVLLDRQGPGRAIPIGLFTAAIALAATTGPALAGLVTLLATVPLLFLSIRSRQAGHRILTNILASVLTAVGFGIIEQSRVDGEPGPLLITIPLQSALTVAVVLIVRRLSGAPYPGRMLSQRDLAFVVTPIVIVAVALEAASSDRYPIFTALVCLAVLSCLIMAGSTINRSRARAGRLVDGLVAALDQRHPDTSAHSTRVYALVSRMLDDIPELTPHERDAIMTASLIHDIGKIATPDQALLKPGSLTADERAIMQQHSAIGAEIVWRLDGLEATAPIVRHHHERWDGAGYPDGLVGPGIPLGARMIAVADTYDAMTHDRVYRRALGHTEALAELLAERGRQFDPIVVDIFSRVIVSERRTSGAPMRGRQVAS